MAEERLIDDDIDRNRKFRVRVGEDGEEELYIDEPPTESEEMVFLTPDDEDEDDDDVALALEREQERQENERRRTAELEAAQTDISSGRFSTALEHIAAAAQCGADEGATGLLYMRAYTKDFTDFAQIVPASEHAAEAKGGDAETRRNLLARAGGGLEDNIKSLRAKVAELDAQNSEAKKQREVRLKAQRAKCLAAFFAALVPFIVCLALCIYFAAIIYTVSTGLYLALTVSFGCLALLLLVVWAFACRKLITVCTRLRQNRLNSSTKLGRELLVAQSKLRAFIAVLGALKE